MQIQGVGLFTFANGGRYDGAWLRGKMHGQGYWRSRTNPADWFNGSFVNGSIHGTGVYHWGSLNSTYNGTFERGAPHGRGVQTLAGERAHSLAPRYITPRHAMGSGAPLRCRTD